MEIMAFTHITLKIKIGIDADIYSDPKEDFLNKLSRIDNVEYEILSNNLIEENSLIEKIFINGLTDTIKEEDKSYAIGTPYDKSNEIVVVFKKFLDRIIISDHLILVDPYIFSDNNIKQNYSNFLIEIFNYHLKKIQKVTFVTSKNKFKKETQRFIYEGFHNIKNKITLETKFSSLFHDRYWICGNRGIFVGTSLNGIGSKYCLIDYIKSSDLIDIKRYLSNEKLI